jgi:hypothetical protein
MLEQYMILSATSHAATVINSLINEKVDFESKFGGSNTKG